MSEDATAIAKKLFAESIALLEQEHWSQAEFRLNEALKYAPDRPSLLNNLSIALIRQRKFNEASTVISRVVELEPDAADTWSNWGELHNELGRHSAALQCFDRAVALDPDLPQAHLGRGIALRDIGQHEAALKSFEQALHLAPSEASGWLNRGNALAAIGCLKEALDSHARALALRPHWTAAYVSRARALITQGLYDAALVELDSAIKENPRHAEAHLVRGSAKLAMGNKSAALDDFDAALAINHDYMEAWLNRAAVLEQSGRYPEAIAAYERVGQITPDTDPACGHLLHAKMRICNWSSLDTDIARVKRKIGESKKVANPFSALSFFDCPDLHRKVAEAWNTEKLPINANVLPFVQQARRNRIRVGYFSPDFRNHPVAHLAAGLYEAHNRQDFELIGFSLGPNTGDPIRKRISAAFDQFLDVSALVATEIHAKARSLELDIAVDLGGYTEFTRSSVFMLRAAPVQVNYLGYPGTLGIANMDYLMGDNTIITAENRQHFTEKIIFLPHCYQANDDKRAEIPVTFSRNHYGLPEKTFVFCCFNNNFKITPKMFACWMRILRKVESSVLWLLEDNPYVADNLRREAISLGISAERLIFAVRTSQSEHLARHHAADLFLDTLPYNAHTTASDSLWLGLPLLTCMGASFASRVAASLLRTAGLPELITETMADYEAAAIALANNPDKLLKIRQRLIETKRTTPLFNTALFTQHVESAYRAIYDRSVAGLLPTDLHVQTLQ